MFAKIAQLRGNSLEDSFEVEYGIEFQAVGIATLSFANMQLAYNNFSNFQHITYCWEMLKSEEYDGFKFFFVNNLGIDEERLSEELIEEKLFVVIQHAATIETTAEKIAGRYPTEAILEMSDGDIVKVSKGVNSKPETYVVVQVGNELFLIKKNR